ncbi:MAG: LysM peptidoglycan-binding domain-containing protein [Anaerolineae bacterium]|nr:LysM peptidoglycan-binding domain-containing protein [Anaerolineae bacterium]
MRRILTLGIVLALTLALAAPAFAQGTTVHVVQRGENLFRIALRYGVTVNTLAATNGLNNVSRIYAGQRLVIPTGGSTTSPTSPSSGVYIVRRGENLFRIALRYGTTAQAIASANGIANPSLIYVGQTLTIPSSGTEPPSPPTGDTTYTVQPGDNLFRIALRYNISYLYLAQYNGIASPSNIYVGQVLRIPPH